jgi:hypothetical protein
MSYLVCEECGKFYELKEGKLSFSYEKCTCGGKLTYTDSLNGINRLSSSDNSKLICSNCETVNPKGSKLCYNCGNEFTDKSRMIEKKPINQGISWLGVAVGFGFLMGATLFSVLAIFGTNIPQKAEDIPYNLLMAFGIITMLVAIISGLISSFIGGSINFKNGIINGGLVGLLLGLLVGATSGNIAFLGVIAVFGSLSVLGGIFGTLLKRKL